MFLSADRFKKSLTQFVRRVTGRYDYAAAYMCTVVSQNADGTLELKPDATTQLPPMPGVSSIPIRYGIPGVRVTVAAGARVALMFEGCDPGLPFASLWDPTSLTSMTVTASSTVTVNGTSVVLGGNQAASIALSQPMQTALTTLQSAMNGLASDTVLTSSKVACQAAATVLQLLLQQGIGTKNTTAQ